MTRMIYPPSHYEHRHTLPEYHWNTNPMPDGTLAQCDCGEWFFFGWMDGYCWRPVRWCHWRMKRRIERERPVGVRGTCRAETTYNSSDVPLYCALKAGHYPATPHVDPASLGTTRTGFWWER